MGIIRVRFIENRGFFSSGIAWWTGSLFSHCEFGTPEGTWIGALVSGGIQERAANYCTPSREFYYEIPCTDAEEAEMLRWAGMMIGTQYNKKTIAGLLIQARGLNTPGKMICSEFLILGLIHTLGAWKILNTLSTWAYRITPETAHLSPIFVGNLKRKIG